MMDIMDGAFAEAKIIAAIMKAGEQLRDKDEDATRTQAYQAARRAYDNALRETIYYLRALRSDPQQYDWAKEAELSALWSDASIAMADLDPDLSNRCFIKGQGWLDPSVWNDPRYKQFAIGIDDMRHALIAFNATQGNRVSGAKHSATASRPMEKVKILFLSANPQSTSKLNLDEEARDIDTKLRASDYRDLVEFITKWAARPDDLLQFLNQYKPDIVHFSGHGNETNELILLDRKGAPKPVSKDALVNLFRIFKDNTRVVLLNACFSQVQARAITEEIDCAIGMMQEIGDEAAITFAASFYRAIGFGRSVKEAFDQGRAALLLEGIPEEMTPILMTGKRVDPRSIVLVRPR
jgi:hypothetical protein